MAGFTRAIAQELATQGITVNCVAPGPINTRSMARVISERPDLAEKYVAMVPMKRMGEPEEIANMIVFLASDDASYITGQEISVDGGQRM